MSEKVKQSTFTPVDLDDFAVSGNAYIPGFVDKTTNVKIPASDFIAPIQSISVDDEPITPDVNGNVNIDISIPQSDWNENDQTSPAYIQNKPTIPAAQVNSDWDENDQTSPAYIQNKPTIPAAQVNSDWTASSGIAEILNKPNLDGYVSAKIEQNFNDNEKALARQNIGINDGGQIIRLQWDGTTNIYNNIAAQRDDGYTVILENKTANQTYLPLVDTGLPGRLVYISMTAKHVMYYVTFSPTNVVIHTDIFAETYDYSASHTAEYIWTHAFEHKPGFFTYTDNNGDIYLYTKYDATSTTFTFYNTNFGSEILAYKFIRTGSDPNYTYSSVAVPYYDTSMVIARADIRSPAGDWFGEFATKYDRTNALIGRPYPIQNFEPQEVSLADYGVTITSVGSKSTLFRQIAFSRAVSIDKFAMLIAPSDMYTTQPNLLSMYGIVDISDNNNLISHCSDWTVSTKYMAKYDDILHLSDLYSNQMDTKHNWVFVEISLGSDIDLQEQHNYLFPCIPKKPNIDATISPPRFIAPQNIAIYKTATPIMPWNYIWHGNVDDNTGTLVSPLEILHGDTKPPCLFIHGRMYVSKEFNMWI